MSLPIPDLDDKTYEDLLQEAIALIPVYNKEWTNHNPPDPGITLLELFAWLAEMVIFRLNQVPDENYEKFLKLIGINLGLESLFITETGFPGYLDNKEIHKDMRKLFVHNSCPLSKTAFVRIVIQGEEWFIDDRSYYIQYHIKKEGSKLHIYKAEETIDAGIQRGLTSLFHQYRCITGEDYEALALECMTGLDSTLTGRIICVNNRNLDYGQTHDEKPGHVSIIIIPGSGGRPDYCTTWGMPTGLLLNEVRDYLDERRLITTRLHVVKPWYREIKVEAWITLKVNTKADLDKAVKRLEEYFDPVTGGPDKKGWPLGRNLYCSELCNLLENIEGIDHVVKIKINDESDAGYAGVGEYELIKLSPAPALNIKEETDE